MAQRKVRNVKSKILLSGVLVVAALFLLSVALTPPAVAETSQFGTVRPDATSANGNRHHVSNDVTALAPTSVITVGGNITSNTTLTAGNVYVIYDQDVTVDVGVTLTVEPGAIVKFNGDGPGSGFCDDARNQRNLFVDGRLIADGTQIVGLTDCGRATVETLRMNNPRIVRARRLWASVGWHPPTE